MTNVSDGQDLPSCDAGAASSAATASPGAARRSLQPGALTAAGVPQSAAAAGHSIRPCCGVQAAAYSPTVVSGRPGHLPLVLDAEVADTLPDAASSGRGGQTAVGRSARAITRSARPASRSGSRRHPCRSAARRAVVASTPRRLQSGLRPSARTGPDHMFMHRQRRARTSGLAALRACIRLVTASCSSRPQHVAVGSWRKRARPMVA